MSVIFVRVSDNESEYCAEEAIYGRKFFSGLQNEPL